MANRSSWTEWVLLFFSLVLASAGVLMFLEPRHSHDRLMGLTVSLGFLLASLTFVTTLWRRHQGRGYRSVGKVTLAPGAKLHIKKGRLLFLGAVMGGFGSLIMVTAGMEKEYIVVGAGAVFALAGAALLLLLATGLAGSNYLLFEKEGLRVGDARGSFLIVWDNISQLQAGEYQGNGAFFLWFKDPVAAAATARGKRWSAQKVLKGFKSTKTWQGSDWMILPWQYGVDAVLLAKAVATYVTDPSVREGLEERWRLPDEKGKENS